MSAIRVPGWILDGVQVMPLKLGSDGMRECRLLQTVGQYRAGDSVWVHDEALEEV